MILSEVVDLFEASLEGLDGLDVKIGVSDSRMSARAELSYPGLNRIAVLEANRGTWFELWLGIVGEELFSLPEFELDVDDFTEGLAIHTRYALQFMRGVGIGPIWSRGRVEYFDLDTPEGPMRFQRGDNSWREFLRVLFGWETPVRGPRMWPPAATPPPPTLSPPGGDGEHCEDR